MKEKAVDKACEVLLYIIGIVAIIAFFNTSCKSANSTRDLAYEAYCDSIWFNDRDYYMDTLVESDKYQQYIEDNGQWWEDNCPAYQDLEREYKELEKANKFKYELLEAQERCIKEAEVIMFRNGLYDEYYAKLKFTVDSLCATQL